MKFPKPKRKKNRKLLNSFKNKPCVICGNTLTTVAHHIKTKGARGDDSETNLYALCWVHHAEVHRGAKTFKKKYNL